MNEERRKKRNLAAAAMLIIMAIALCITMISCEGSKDAGGEQSGIKSEQTLDDKIGSEDGDDANKEVTDSEKSKVKEQREATKKENKETADQKKESQKSTQKTAQKETQKSTQAATQAKKVCYISIEGFCSNKEISLQGGDTAYSILCRSGASVSGSSSYVKGINGRFEFDEGPTSGWMYYVNGSRPVAGCGSCSIKAGDSIRWDYVTGY